MRNTVLLSSLLSLLLLVSCNTADTDRAEAEAAQAQAAKVQNEQPAAPVQAGDSYEPVAGSILALDTGEEVTVLSVGDFDQRLKELSGLVAIEGRVKEAYPERGALVLVDCANMQGCGDGCCPQAEVPVRLALEEYSGSLPDADREIVVIADVTVLEAGYDLAIREIRQGGKTMLSAKT
jgi:hypothetical protein